jgi:hypothetical protein
MIGKPELRAKLFDLMSSVDTPVALQEKLAEFMAYSIENYEHLDAEAKVSIDRTLEELRNQAKNAIEQMPDGSQKREFERIVGAVEGKHFKAENLLAALETPSELKLEIVPAARAAFMEVLQRILDFLFDTSRRIHQGFDVFAIVGLFYWAVDELLAGFHLAQRGFANQCYTHVRTVDEILDKIQLFHQQPKWTALWVTGSESEVWKELRPAAVRKKLGQPKHDPIYSFFSSLGPHGTFRGLQARTAMAAQANHDGSRMLRIWVGGTPQIHHIVWANTMCVYCAMRALVKCAATLEKWLDHEEVLSVYQSVVGTTKRFLLDHYVGWAQSEGLDIVAITELLGKAPFQTDQ